MTETSSAPASLSTMRMAELQQLAASMGLKGISRMRKSELITAIRHSDRTAAPQIVDDAVPVAGSEPGPTASRAADEVVVGGVVGVGFWLKLSA